MPKGIPRTNAQRRERHKKKYGSLKNFPKKRKGKIVRRNEKGTTN